MKQFDPFAPVPREEGDATITAGLEITQGSTYKQNYLLRFSDECIIVADGISDESACGGCGKVCGRNRPMGI
jgi:hypothetical protein